MVTVMSNLSQAVSSADYRAMAKRRLPAILFDYVDGGAYRETTLQRNASDFDDILLQQRVMRDMSVIETAIDLFGASLALPVILAPVGFAGMLARRGEVQAARAAAAAGIPFCLSTVGVCTAAEVRRDAGVPPWFQLYVTRDRGLVRSLLEQASAAASPVLVLTVDLPTPGARYRDQRSGMARGLGLTGQMRQAASGVAHPAWLWDVYLRGRPHNFGSLAAAAPAAADFAAAWQWIGQNFDPSVTWADLDFIRAHWSGPIIVKGIMAADDARVAVRCGVDGIIVSNHGGRQLDGVSSTIKALPAIADAVGGALPVLVDGGIRSGLDVLKAIEAGATACLLGRAWAFALAAGGEAGVTRMLGQIAAELRTAMVLTGRNSIMTREGA